MAGFQKFELDNYHYIQRVLNISKVIAKLYNNLTQIKINNKGDSLEYNTSLQDLNYVLETEDEIYNNVLEDCDNIEIFAMRNFLVAEFDMIGNKYTAVNEAINNSDSLIPYRIYERLTESLPGNALSGKTKFLNELFYRGFNYVTDDIIKTKMNMAFVDKTIEQEYLYDNHSIDAYVNKDYLFNAAIYNKGVLEQSKKKQMLCLLYSYKIVNEIMEYEDSDLNNMLNYTDVLLDNAYLQAIFEVMDKTSKEEFLNYYKTLLNNDYLSSIDSRVTINNILTRSIKEKVKNNFSN